jgi:hypothetical protein
MTTATNFVPMLNRQGWLAVEVARTVKRGVLPDWYQYCGDERVSRTLPRVQASVPPDAGGLLARCRAGAGLGLGERDGAGGVWPVCACGGAEPAAPVPPDGAVWPAVDRAVSAPVTSQPRAVSNPKPAPRTTTRRRQYVAGESFAGRARAPYG